MAQSGDQVPPTAPAEPLAADRPRTPPNLHLRQLAYLREVERQGSLTRAAKLLRVSQPALSQSLAELERRLGLSLFERVGRDRRLTDEGREVLAFAEHLLAEADELQDRLSARQRGEQGVLRVGMIDAASLYLLPAVVSDYRRAHPAVELRLRVDSSAELLRRLRSFELDLVFAIGPADDDLVADEVLTERLYVYAPAGRGADPEDADWALYPAGSRTRELIDAAMVRLGLTPRVTLESNNPQVLRQMVSLGLGWSVLPAAVGEQGEQSLRRWRRGSVVQRSLLAMRRANAPPNPRVQDFLRDAADVRS